MTGGRGSRVENAAVDLLLHRVEPQLDALAVQLNLQTGGSTPAEKASSLWKAAESAGGTVLADLDELMRQQQNNPDLLPDYWLFVSRASGENDDAACQIFFDNLVKKLRVRQVVPAQGDARHLDSINRQQPDLWSPWSLRAMQRCRVLVCLHSKNYFSNPYCGKVWAAFLNRLEAQFGYQFRVGDPPPLIVPVAWGPPDERFILPRVARDIPDPLSFDDEYVQKGLLFIQKRAQANRDDYPFRYEMLLDKLAGHIAAIANAQPLAEDADIPPLARLTNPFRQPPGEHPAEEEQPGSYARFVVFAATNQSPYDISGLRDVSCYGPSPQKWRPYHPQSMERVEYTVSVCATAAGRTADFIPLDEEFRHALRSAALKQEPIIVLCDPWTAQSRIYDRYERAYDDAEAPGSRILVCRNGEDSETTKNWNKLRSTIVKLAFPLKYLSFWPARFRDDVRLERFRDELTEAIVAAHNQTLTDAPSPAPLMGLSFIRPQNVGVPSPATDPDAVPVRAAFKSGLEAIPQPRVQSPSGGPSA